MWCEKSSTCSVKNRQADAATILGKTKTLTEAYMNFYPRHRVVCIEQAPSLVWLPSATWNSGVTTWKLIGIWRVEKRPPLTKHRRKPDATRESEFQGSSAPGRLTTGGDQP